MKRHSRDLPKTLLVISMVLSSLVGSLYAAASTILLNNLKQAEAQHTRQAVTGVLSVFTQVQADFAAAVTDWAEWDDTYAFVEDGNDDYIQTNLTPEGLAVLKLNLMLFIQSSGRITFGTGFDLTSQKFTPLPEALKAHLSTNDLLLKHDNIDSSVEGIVLLPEGPMLINSQPILTSKGEGPIQGTLIFGRFLDANEIARLSKITRSTITVHGLKGRMPPDFQAIRNSLSPNVILVRPLGEQVVAGYTLIKDIYGKPNLLLRVDVPREIYWQGKNSLLYLLVSLAVMGLVFGSITLLLVQRLSLSERQRQQSEERYRTVVAQAAEGIFLVDADTKQILETNTAFEKLLGYTSAAVRNLTLYDVIADERESIDHNLQLILTEHHRTGERQYRRQDGLLIEVEDNASLICDQERNVFCIIIRDITKRKQVEAKLLYEASHDSLTGLANRALFMERLEYALQERQRQEDYFFVVLFLDLDDFKQINDNLGHLVGDQLLIAIAQRLKKCFRASDTFARLGGDEFAVILAGIQGDGYATQIVERIQQQLKLPFNLNEQEVFASASIGVILEPKIYSQPEELLRDADIAMYRAKAMGKARYQVFGLATHD